MAVTDRLHWVAFQKPAEGGGRGERGCVCPRPAVCLGGQWDADTPGEALPLGQPSCPRG